MGVAQLFERSEQAFPLHQLCKFGRHLDRTNLFILPDHGFDGVARAFADLLANILEDAEHMICGAAFDQRPGIWNSVEGRLHRYLGPGAEFLFHIVGKDDAGATADAGLNRRLEFVLLHGRTHFPVRVVELAPSMSTTFPWNWDSIKTVFQAVLWACRDLRSGYKQLPIPTAPRIHGSAARMGWPREK